MTEQVQDAIEILKNVTLVSSYSGQTILTVNKIQSDVVEKIVKAYESAQKGGDEIFDFGSGVLVSSAVLKNMVLVISNDEKDGE